MCVRGGRQKCLSPFKHQKIKIMFIDERTQTPIYADLGVSVSHGTLRACDLIPKFIDVIRDTAEWTQIMSNPTLGWGDIGVIFDPTPYNENDERWDSEGIAMFLNEDLWNILNLYAPDGYYFGANEGDGSDFGYWKSEE